MGKLISWKHSKIRFYLKNMIWNYRFWIYAKPVYVFRKYKIPIHNLEEKLTDGFDYYYDTFNQQYEYREVKRFMGYQYKDKIYLDNMGMENIDEDTWISWIKKRLVN